MRYVATYLLAVLGGNANPSAGDIKRILGSVGIEANDEHLNKVVGELNGKDINKVIDSGMSRLASVPPGGGFGGGAIVAPTASAIAGLAAVGSGASAPPEVEQEEKDDSGSGSDDDMGFGLFD